MSLIPPELCDQIIDCLHDNRQVLQACALVCTEWLPRAQAHLFHTLPPLTPDKQQKLLQLFESQPHLRHYPRTLDIKHIYTSYCVTLLSLCPNLSGLVFTQCIFDRFEKIQEIISANSSLTELTLQFVTIPNRAAELENTPARENSINTLRIHLLEEELNVTSFMRWAIAINLFPHVQTLEYSEPKIPFGSSGAIGIVDFMKTYAENMVNLGFVRMPFFYTDRYCGGFQALPNLKSLSIQPDLSNLRSSFQYEWLLEKLPEIVDGLKPNTHMILDLENWEVELGMRDSTFTAAFKGLWLNVAQKIESSNLRFSLSVYADDVLLNRENELFSPLVGFKDAGLFELIWKTREYV